MSSAVTSIIILAALAGGSYLLYKKVKDNVAATDQYSEENFYGNQWNRDHSTYFRNVQAATKESDGSYESMHKILLAKYGHK